MAVKSQNPTNRRSAVRGQSMVETALFLPVLVVFMAGLIQIGMAANVYMSVINSTREGVRYGSHDDSYTLQQIAGVTQLTAAPVPLTAGNATIIVTRVKTTTTNGTPSVTSYTYAYASGLGQVQATRLPQSEVLTRFSRGVKVNGSDEFVVVEFFYNYPLSILNVTVPMYTYSIMRVIGN